MNEDIKLDEQTLANDMFHVTRKNVDINLKNSAASETDASFYSPHLSTNNDYVISSSRQSSINPANVCNKITEQDHSQLTELPNTFSEFFSAKYDPLRSQSSELLGTFSANVDSPTQLSASSMQSEFSVDSQAEPSEPSTQSRFSADFTDSGYSTRATNSFRMERQLTTPDVSPGCGKLFKTEFNLTAEADSKVSLDKTFSNAQADTHSEYTIEKTCYIEHENSSSENDTQDVVSDESQSPSPEDDSLLIIAYAKHQLVVKLMREVYTIFDQSWTANVQSRTGSESSNSNVSSLEEHSGNDLTRGNERRRKRDRDFAPPNDPHGKKKKENPTPSSLEDETRLFACPFHKFDQCKYSCNATTGLKYRACMGPGFKKIARVK